MYDKLAIQFLQHTLHGGQGNVGVDAAGVNEIRTKLSAHESVIPLASNDLLPRRSITQLSHGQVSR